MAEAQNRLLWNREHFWLSIPNLLQLPNVLQDLRLLADRS